MNSHATLKSPYSYFGGKSKVAPIIWQALGKVSNYVEPFAGSLAVLLNNPNPAKIETVNEIDNFIVNFWRAVVDNPEAVAKIADYPITETDLHVRHKWLVSNATDDFHMKITTDPDFYDIKIAGWWIWGIGASISGNWLQTRGLNSIPSLSNAGAGIHGLTNDILEWFKKFQQRMRRVRITCGDWKKVLTPAVTFKNKGLSNPDITGIFLDPPYNHSHRTKKIYKEDKDIFPEVLDWAIQNGDNPKLRIVLCGYESVLPDTWKSYSWKTAGGMSNQALGDSQGKDNSKKEMIYFSPYCLEVI
jgi:DNA adenine methylase